MAKTIKYNGTAFASNFEVDLAKWFDSNSIRWEYEPCRIAWRPAVRYYKPDFKIILPTGEEFLLEAKGFFDGSARSKMIQVKEQHPDLDIRMVFMKDNVLSRKSKNSTTYKEWAEKYGFPCFDVVLPKKENSTRGRKPKAKGASDRKSNVSNRGRAKAGASKVS